MPLPLARPRGGKRPVTPGNRNRSGSSALCPSGTHSAALLCGRPSPPLGGSAKRHRMTPKPRRTGCRCTSRWHFSGQRWRRPLQLPGTFASTSRGRVAGARCPTPSCSEPSLNPPAVLPKGTEDWPLSRPFGGIIGSSSARLTLTSSCNSYVQTF